MFPDSLIIDEFNLIDFVVIEENLPVEIQSTLYNKTDNAVMHCGFENAIRKQIEDNIENYDRCWFFFDYEYYRYLNESKSLNISLNLDWLAKYVKEDKLEVFTVKYDGEIRHLAYKDLEFIRSISNTCKIEYENDERVLNRNKIKIFKNILKGYEFTQDEIDNTRKLFNNRNKIVNSKRNCEKFQSFLIKNGDDRAKLYGYAWESIFRLRLINDFLDMKEVDEHVMFDCMYNGILKSIGTDRKQFVDTFDICKFFPGYLRHKDDWNDIKDGTFGRSQFRDIFLVKNKKQSTFDY